MQKATYAQIAKRLDLQPSGARLLAHICCDLLLLGLFLSTNQGMLYLVSQLLLPILMFRSFALMHECVHGSAVRSKLLNDVVGIVAGAVCLLPFEPWKKIHLLHHKWTGNVDQDPSMGLIREFPKYGRRRVSLLNFCWRHGIPALAVSQHVVFWAKSYRFVVAAQTRQEKLKNGLSVLVPLVVYGTFSWAKNIPGLVLYLAMVEVINFPHHLQMPMLEGKASFPVHDQHLTARSCYYSRWFSRHVINNFNLHVEHHLFPRLPWYRLELASDEVRAALEKGYTSIQGHAWIRENRPKHIDQVLAKTVSPVSDKAA